MEFELNNGIVEITLSWTEFKDYVDGTFKTLSLQYIETAKSYKIFCIDSSILYKCELFKVGQEAIGVDHSQNATDLSDFESNFKSSGNKPICRLDNTAKPTTLSISGKHTDSKIFYVFSPDLCDKSTWYFDAIKVTAETPSGTVDGVNKVFTLDCDGDATAKLLQVYGKVTNALALKPCPHQTGTDEWGTAGEYIPVVTINGTPQVMDRPYRTLGDKDYSWDVNSHEITFTVAPPNGAAILVTYWYVPTNAAGHLIRLVNPPPGKKWTIDYVESQLSADTEYNDTIIFAPYPRGVYSVPLEPELHYTSAHEVDDYSIRSAPVIEAWGGATSPRRASQPKNLKFWEYVEELSVSSAIVPALGGLGGGFVELNARLESGTPFTGERATITVRVLEENI